MKFIRNPFVELSGYNCFGCSPTNPMGLKMQFHLDGDYVISKWTPHSHYQGWYHILHGGIQASLMDEIASWVVFVKVGSSGVTQHMEIEYKKPVPIKHPIVLKATLKYFENPRAVIQVELYSQEELCTTGIFTYFVYPFEFAKKKFYYPGIEAFFE
ncbi:MAG: PaaI family thioesterase [Bacteroidales bacterium]|nr:PaaI family thioesterase [Bacteroidales bacterium]